MGRAVVVELEDVVHDADLVEAHLVGGGSLAIREAPGVPLLVHGPLHLRELLTTA